jgi:hypothetical protein
MSARFSETPAMYNVGLPSPSANASARLGL